MLVCHSTNQSINLSDLFASTPSVAALTAQWAAQHGHNNNGVPHHPSSSSSNLLTIPSTTSNAVMGGASTTPVAASASVVNANEGGAAPGQQMIYDYPAKGIIISDKVQIVNQILLAHCFNDTTISSNFLITNRWPALNLR